MKPSRLALSVLCLTLAALPFIVALGPGAAPLASDGPADQAAPTGAPERTGALGRNELALAEEVPPDGWYPYHARPGTHLEFALDAMLSTCQTQAGATVGRMSIGFAGALSIVVLARAADGVALAVDFSRTSPELRQEGAANPGNDDGTSRLRAAFAEPISVWLAPDGEVLGYRFPAACGVELHTLVRALVPTLLPTLRDPGAGPWQHARSGGDVDLESAGRWVGARSDDGLRHARLDIVRCRVTRPGQRPADPQVEGHSDVVLDEALGFVREVASVQGLLVRLRELQMEIRQDLSVGLRLERSTVEVAPDFDLHAEPWSAADGRDDLAIAEAAAERDRWQSVVASLRTKDVFWDLVRIAQDESAGVMQLAHLRQRLQWLLRLRPEAIGEVDALLGGGELPDRALLAVMLAVAEADVDGGNALLERWIRDGSRTPVSRLVAASALFEAPHAPASLQAAAYDLWRDASATAELRSTALLVLGTLTARARESGSRDAPAAVARLLEAEARAARDGMLSTWLCALGNSGAPEAMDAVRRHFGSTDADVQYSAITAAGGLTTSQAGPFLLDVATRQMQLPLRVRALEMLALRIEFDCDRSIARIALEDPAVEIRAAAVAALAQRGCDDVALLRRIASSDADPTVRNAAETAVRNLEQRHG